MKALSAAIGACIDDASRRQKFVWGAPVSNHPNWLWQAIGGVVLAAAAFAAAMFAQGGRQDSAPDDRAWLAIALNAVVAGVFAGWTIENIPIESLGAGAWLRSLAFAAVAIGAPIAGAAALAASSQVPAFSRVIGARTQRSRDALALTLGLLFVALTVLAVQSALALSFDPRYRDFPFAPMTAAVVPFALVSLIGAAPRRRAAAGRGRRSRGSGLVCGLHRLERDARQLAGAVVCRNAYGSCGKPVSGAGRARLRISSATANDDSAAL